MKKIFTLILILLSLNSCIYFNSERIELKEGRGVLKHSSYENHKIHYITGEIEFYESIFLPPSVDSQRVDYIDINSSWDEYGIDNNGYGTYRFTIKTGAIYEKMAILIPNLSSAYIIYIDGEMAGSVGYPCPDIDKEIPGCSTEQYNFIPEKQETEFVIHISNYHRNRAGFIDIAYIGRELDIKRFHEARQALYTFIFGSLLCIGLYLIISHTYYNEDHKSKYLGVFCILYAIRIIVSRDVMLSSLMELISFDFYIKLRHITFFAIVPIFFTYLVGIVKNRMTTIFHKSLVILGLLFILLRIIFPLTSLPYLVLSFQIITTLSIFAGEVAIIGTYLKKQKDSGIYLIVLTVLTFFVANDLMHFTGIAYSYLLTPFGVLLLVLSQALLVSKHNYNTYMDKVKLNTELNKINIELENRIKKATEELSEKNRKLEDMVVKDGLTNLYNHNYLLKTLNRRISEAERHLSPLSIIMLDIDFFKKVNDIYGHITGDNVLKDIADVIKGSIRMIDIAGRYGGEEFMIICPETSEKQAYIVAGRISHAVRELKFQNIDLHVTISGGVAQYRIKETSMSLIDRADRKLYLSKETGRDRITI